MYMNGKKHSGNGYHILPLPMQPAPPTATNGGTTPPTTTTPTIPATGSISSIPVVGPLISGLATQLGVSETIILIGLGAAAFFMFKK